MIIPLLYNIRSFKHIFFGVQLTELDKHLLLSASSQTNCLHRLTVLDQHHVRVSVRRAAVQKVSAQTETMEAYFNHIRKKHGLINQNYDVKSHKYEVKIMTKSGNKIMRLEIMRLFLS